jgi:hypothetical protein
MPQFQSSGFPLQMVKRGVGIAYAGNGAELGTLRGMGYTENLGEDLPLAGPDVLYLSDKTRAMLVAGVGCFTGIGVVNGQ